MLSLVLLYTLLVALLTVKVAYNSQCSVQEHTHAPKQALQIPVTYTYPKEVQRPKPTPIHTPRKEVVISKYHAREWIENDRLYQEARKKMYNIA